MKKYILMVSVFISKLASAHVIEVSEAQKIIYYTPTPTLEVEVTDLEDSGGMFSLSLSYDNASARDEEESLKLKYPGYGLKLMMAQHATEVVRVEIPEIGLSQETLVKQGQLGPYLNLQLLLKPEQVSKLKKLSAKPADLLKLVIPASSGYQSLQILETYSSTTICSEIRAQRLDQLMMVLLSLKKPVGLQRPETFLAYKKSILENCFDVAPAKVTTFKDLLKLEIKTKASSGVVTATYSTNQWVEAKYDLVPRLRLRIN